MFDACATSPLARSSSRTGNARIFTRARLQSHNTWPVLWSDGAEHERAGKYAGLISRKYLVLALEKAPRKAKNLLAAMRHARKHEEGVRVARAFGGGVASQLMLVHSCDIFPWDCNISDSPHFPPPPPPPHIHILLAQGEASLSRPKQLWKVLRDVVTGNNSEYIDLHPYVDMGQLVVLPLTPAYRTYRVSSVPQMLLCRLGCRAWVVALGWL